MIDIDQSFKNYNYPDFLFSPIFLKDACVESDYNRKEDDELLRAVKMMPNKFNTLDGYYNALTLYNTYMDTLIDRFDGNLIYLQQAKLNGWGNIFIPDHPKAGKKIKDFIKIGRVSSSLIKLDKIDLEDIVEQDDDFIYDPEEAIFTTLEPTKKEKKFLTKFFENNNKNRRMESLKSRDKSNVGFDLIAEYYNQAYSMKSTSKGYIDERPFADQVKDFVRSQDEPEIDKLLKDMDGMITYRGRFVQRYVKNQFDVYNYLQKNGFDVVHFIKSSSMSKKEQEKAFLTMGMNVPVRKKDIKKYKKMQKKLNKQKMESNKCLRDIITNNKISLNNNLDAALNFTFEDMMGGYNGNDD